MTVTMREPTLQDMLSDPIILTLMKADKVERQTVEATMRAVVRTPSPPIAPEDDGVMAMLRGLCRPDGQRYCPV